MYNDFSLIYDRFQEIDYREFINFYKEVFNQNNYEPHSIIDLGCGSGEITVLLSKEGYEITGIDISSDMLSIAQNKAFDNGVDITFLNQDMTEFSVLDKADAVISSLDCINYLPCMNDVKETFSRVYESLKPNGIFIFDINSEYKLSNILGNNTFVYQDDEAYCVWECGYFPEDKVTSFELNFFVKDNSGKYDRYFEYQEEKLYSVRELQSIAEEEGFKKTDVFSDLSFEEPKQDSERIFFVLRK